MMVASFAMRPGAAIRGGMRINSIPFTVRGIGQVTPGEGLGPKVSPGSGEPSCCQGCSLTGGKRLYLGLIAAWLKLPVQKTNTSRAKTIRTALIFILIYLLCDSVFFTDFSNLILSGRGDIKKRAPA